MRLIYYLGLVNNKLAMFRRNHLWCKHRQPKRANRGVAFFLVFVLLLLVLLFWPLFSFFSQ